ncbi:MAG: glutamine--fructose-6-phosphate transaminase (isomerizing) [Alphaproteobacteria bacterium]|uniref:Glutamine--fructose-6-phosphate aminotransferase [isomerizing] n=1 Tax=Candidatus Nitrobium versatile TaxID=2884831 RepID=A0A953M179_9BACT|nr:glutamine--fructose-6-phosphate transaminase (isomerizing) [Candidatus Nitrobium versatile]
MCGIVGYVGKRISLPVLIDGLKRLEYRGYDSAGIAYQNGKGLEIRKTSGRIRDLEMLLPDPVPDARAGLGHTRWATHGAPSSANAHPHSAGGVAVVHNGIIENYRELKEALMAEGHRFASETDTEVIPQLIAKYLKEGLSLPEALRKSVGHLRGSYAIGVMSEQHPATLFAVRNGSPLIIGIGKGELLFASDIPAMLPYTNRFILMEDGQLCILNESGITLEQIERREAVPLEGRIMEVDWTASMVEKNEFECYMLKEIHEQPVTVAETLGERIDPAGTFSLKSGPVSSMAEGLRRLQIVACGTSYHAGLVGRYLIESLAHLPVEVEIASEYRYRKPLIEEGTLFISITQSGETADTLAAQREAKRRGARTLTLCNVKGSTAAREADYVLYTKAGPEIGVASTKAFTAQMAVLYLLAVDLGVHRGVLDREEANTLIAHLSGIPALIQAVLGQGSAIESLARTIVNAKDLLYLGRGLNYPIALEGALKLKEISYLHAEGYAAGEMKHGPIALIEKGVPVIVVAPDDDLFEKVLSNIEEAKARGGRVLAVTDAPGVLLSKADAVIEIPSVPPLLSPFLTVIPLQLLAYHVARLRGCDVDQPRNLAKSVTVE